MPEVTQPSSKDPLTSAQIEKLNLEIEDLRKRSPWVFYLQHREMEKLNLEIKNLRKKTKWELFLQLIPLATTFVLAGGLVLSVFQFQAAQDRERTERMAAETAQKQRIEGQIRAIREEIFKLARDETQTLSRVSFLFTDLDRALDSDQFPDFKRLFSRDLVYLITNELNFGKGRDIRFMRLVLDYWKDYEIYLKENPESLRFILYSHARALRGVRDANTNYLQRIRYDERTNLYLTPVVRPDQARREQQLFEQFVDILDSFKRHLRFAGEESRGKSIRDESVRDFEGALCNPEIAKQIVGADFKSAPCQ